MKKLFFKKCVAYLIITTLLITTAFSMSVSADTNFSSRSDFSWGINGHNQTYKSYPLRFLEQQIKLAAELGVKIYRFNYNPKSGGDYNYLDKVVDWVYRYDMDLMLVMDDNKSSAELLRARYETVANRYNGKNGHGIIKYIQVFNEVDVWAMTTKDFADVGSRKEGNGEIASHYSKLALEFALPRFKAGIAGIKAGNPNCKIVINISYLHTYLFDYLKANGVTWDITGLDWYANMQNGSFEYILERLMDRYPQDIMICETNIWPNNESKKHDYENDTTFLPQAMEEVYKNYPRVKGMIFYELLDEPQFEMVSGKYDGESHFGFIKVNETDFSIGAKKPIYHRVQQLLGGGSRTPKDSLYKVTDVDPTTTTKGSTANTTLPSNSTTTTKNDPSAPTQDSTSSNESTQSSPSYQSSSLAPTNTSATPSNKPDDDTEEGFPIAAIIAIGIAAFLAAAVIVFLVLKIKFGFFPGFLDGLTKKKP